jgi:hypothetical protein
MPHLLEGAKLLKLNTLDWYYTLLCRAGFWKHIALVEQLFSLPPPAFPVMAGTLPSWRSGIKINLAFAVGYSIDFSEPFK